MSEEELGVLDRGGSPQGRRVKARGSLSVVWCGVAKGLLNLTVLTRRGLRVEEQSQPHGFYFYFYLFILQWWFQFQVPHSRT
jgi:hypothetical protein